MENTHDNITTYLIIGKGIKAEKDKINKAFDNKIQILDRSEIEPKDLPCATIIEKVQENDLIMISAHGLTSKATETYSTLCSSDETKNILKEVSKNTACNFELFTCHSGGAINYTDIPESSTLITLIEHDLLSINSLDDELIINSALFAPHDSPFIRFSSYIFVNPSQMQFAINIGNDIKKSFTSTPLTIEAAKNITIYEAWHNQTLQSFLNFTVGLNFTLEKLNNSNISKLRPNQIKELHSMDLMQNHIWFSQFDTNRSRELSFVSAVNAADVDMTRAFLNSTVDINTKLESDANALHIVALAQEIRNTHLTGKNATELRIAYSNIVTMLINKTEIALDEKEKGGVTALHM